ncbi:MAG: aldehyde dehydrogenase, partial [Conexibacter sp.]|nr:aldehyde dehydrogenase [Conexibacter sp.]
MPVAERLVSTNPADLEDVVFDGVPADAEAFVAAARAAREAPPAWAATPAP